MDLPIGSIIVWASETIPSGWQLCDGTNGSPNLVDKFILGASSDLELLTTGGSTTHTHTNSTTGTSSAHNHGTTTFNLSTASGTTIVGGTGTPVAAGGHRHSSSTTSSDEDSHSHSVGSTVAASHLPPYIKLYFIIRVS